MLVDKPTPGLGYVLLYLGLMLFLVVVPIFLRRFRKLRGGWGAAVFAVCCVAAAFFLIFLYSGFTTEYSLDGNTLYMRSGFLAKGQVNLADITEIRKVPTNWQALGWALNRTGYCNRFANALRLTTDKALIYLTPSDPDRFVEEIRSRQRKSNLLRKNLVFR